MYIKPGNTLSMHQHQFSLLVACALAKCLTKAEKAYLSYLPIENDTITKYLFQCNI